MFREITKLSLKNFAKSRKFRPNFYFVFRENFAKLEENFAKHEIKISRNFGEIAKNENFRGHPSHYISIERDICGVNLTKYQVKWLIDRYLNTETAT